MMKFIKGRFALVILCLMLFLPGIADADVIAGAKMVWRTHVVGQAATSAGAVHAAVTDTGSQQVITTGINPLNYASRISATSGGTAADIAAIQVIIVGTDPNDTAITETLPIFTVNTATTVIGVKIFKSVTSITIPAHDGTAATTSIESGGSPAVADADGVMDDLIDAGVTHTVTTGTSINHLDVPRNITATSGGGALDIGAVQVVVTGTNIQGVTITETLPIFTANSATTVTGSKIFQEVTSLLIPKHDGTTATTSVGIGNVLGMPQRLKRNTIRNTYLANVLEGTAPTITFDADDLESNGADLNSALNSTQVIIEYAETPW